MAGNSWRTRSRKLLRSLTYEVIKIPNVHVHVPQAFPTYNGKSLLGTINNTHKAVADFFRLDIQYEIKRSYVYYCLKVFYIYGSA